MPRVPINNKFSNMVGKLGSDVNFSPEYLTLENLVCWYDASDLSTIVESGGFVSQWDDKSGNGYHMTMPVAGRQPRTNVRTLGGLNALDFDGSDGMSALMALPGGGNSMPLEGPNYYDENLFIIMIVDIDSYGTDSSTYLFRYGGANSGIYKHNLYNTPGHVVLWGGGGYSATDLGIDNKIWGLSHVDDVPGRSQEHVASADGVNWRKAIGDGHWWPGPDTSSYLSIMLDNWLYNNGVNGGVGELIMVRNTSYEMRANLEAYLAWKWSGGII